MLGTYSAYTRLEHLLEDYHNTIFLNVRHDQFYIKSQGTIIF